MADNPRSPRRDLRIIEGATERRKGRCGWCARALGLTADAPVEFVYQPDPVEIAGETLEPGWYCVRCLRRAKRTD